MNSFVADPHWGWWIVWYFYLGGIAAGAYFMAALVDLAGDERDRALGRIGYLLAAPLVVICGVLLILDLHQPLRFWHMLLDAETLRPKLKYWSPMSIGAWALLVFGVISAVSFLGALAEAGRCGLGRGAATATRLHRGYMGRAFDMLGTACGFFIASYTGTLLTATNQPVWSDSLWIAALFLASSANTGIAAMKLLARLGMPVSRSSHAKLEQVDGRALWLELVVLVLFTWSIGTTGLAQLAKCGLWLPLVVGVLVCGIVLPLLLRRWPRLLGRATPVLAAVMVLLGGFLLRFTVLAAAPSVLENAQADRLTSGAESLAENFKPRAWSGEKQHAAGLDLLQLVHDRLSLMEQVARAKWLRALPVEDQERERALLDSVRADAAAARLNPDVAEAFFQVQIDAAKSLQRAYFAKWSRDGPPERGEAADLETELRPRLDSLNRRLLDAFSEFRNSSPTPDHEVAFRQHSDRLLGDLELQPADRKRLIDGILKQLRQTSNKRRSAPPPTLRRWSNGFCTTANFT